MLVVYSVSQFYYFLQVFSCIELLPFHGSTWPRPLSFMSSVLWSYLPHPGSQSLSQMSLLLSVVALLFMPPSLRQVICVVPLYLSPVSMWFLCIAFAFIWFLCTGFVPCSVLFLSDIHLYSPVSPASVCVCCSFSFGQVPFLHPVLLIVPFSVYPSWACLSSLVVCMFY